MLNLQEGHTRQRAALPGHREVKGCQCPVSVYSQFLGQYLRSVSGSVSRVSVGVSVQVNVQVSGAGGPYEEDSGSQNRTAAGAGYGRVGKDPAKLRNSGFILRALWASGDF